MAAGDRLLDSSGNVILDVSGNVQLSNGTGDICCCCPCPPTSSTITLTLASIAYNTCIYDDNGGGTAVYSKGITDPNGTFDLSYGGLDVDGNRYWISMDESTWLFTPTSSTIIIDRENYATSDPTCSGSPNYTETFHCFIKVTCNSTTGNMTIDYITDRNYTIGLTIAGFVVHQGGGNCVKNGVSFTSTDADDSKSVHFTGLTATATISW